MSPKTVSGTFLPSERGASTTTWLIRCSSRKRSVSSRCSSSSQLAVPELDEHLVPAELLARPREVVEGGLLRDDVGRELEEEPAQLAGRAQRLERLEEAAEDLGAKLSRRAVDPAALVLRRLVAQVGRELLDLHRVPGHDAERLHVHHEPVRRALGPALDHLLGGQAVVGRVDLDHVEVLRVVAQPLAGRHAFRVPVLGKRLVSPRARPDADRGGHTVSLQSARGSAAGGSLRLRVQEG